MFYDPTFILVLPALFFAMYAQFKVKSTFARYYRKDRTLGSQGPKWPGRSLMPTGCTM